MNAAETIRAAIDKLAAQRAATTTSTWAIAPSTRPQRATLYTSTRCTIFDADADLIVTLHRTIDAQLAILRLEVSALHPAASSFPMTVHAAAFDLARAILGEVS